MIQGPAKYPIPMMAIEKSKNAKEIGELFFGAESLVISSSLVKEKLEEGRTNCSNLRDAFRY